MAKHIISTSTVQTYTSKDGVSLRKVVKQGYLTVPCTILPLIQEGLIDHFEWDDEQGIETMAGENRDHKTLRFELLPVDSAKARFRRLAGADNVKVSSFEDMKAAAALLQDF